MRLLACLPIVVALRVATPAAAETLKMRFSEGTNVHMADGGGAMHWQADITISVDLAKGNKLTATSSGSRTDHQLYGGPSSMSTDDTTTWTTRWTGSWSRTGRRLRLDLVLADHTCKHEKSTTAFDAAKNVWVKYQPEKLACQTAAKQAQLICTDEKIQLSERPKASLAAWRCNAKSSTDLGETPPQWVLGKTACIETRGGKMSSLSYAKCS